MRLHQICQPLCHFIRRPVKSREHQPKPSPTRPSPCGRTTPTVILFRGISPLKYWKTVMATACQTNCRTIMTPVIPMHLVSSKTPMMIVMVLLTSKKMEMEQIRPILIRMATVCVMVQTQLTQFVLLVLMHSRLILLETPILTVTASQIPSTHPRTVFLLWKKIWTMMETDLKTSTKPIRVLTTVQPTQELTHSTQIRMVTEFVMDQSMYMTR